MRRTPLLASALILPLALSASACGDPLRITASQPVTSATLEVYPFSHVPPSYPAAINSIFAQPVPVTAAGNFDIAFALDDEGRVIVMTPRTVLTPAAGVNRVGLLHVAESFETVLSAPAGPYTYDSLLTIVPGEVVVVEAHRGQSGDLCGFAISPFIYSKLRVNSIDPDTYALTVEFTVDPNCGFRSFEPGIPQN
jgi:hypothetical protein